MGKKVGQPRNKQSVLYADISVCASVCVPPQISLTHTPPHTHPHMPAAALKYAASFCFFFVNEILIKLQAKKEFAQQVWRAHTYRTPLLRLLLTGIPLSFTSRQIAGSFIRDAPVHAAYA